MSDLTAAALGTLGACPSRAEMALVASALRDSGDAEVTALFGDAGWNHERCTAVMEFASAVGASGFTALDLYTEFVAPGWVPLGAGDDEEQQ